MRRVLCSSDVTSFIANVAGMSKIVVYELALVAVGKEKVKALAEARIWVSSASPWSILHSLTH